MSICSSHLMAQTTAAKPLRAPWARAIGLCRCVAYLRPANALALLLPTSLALTTSTAASLALGDSQNSD